MAEPSLVIVAEIIKKNGLSIVLFSIFLATLLGQYLTGWKVYAESERQHNREPAAITEYALEGHFVEALFELGKRVSADGGLRRSNHLSRSARLF